jgi:hypothetical protein
MLKRTIISIIMIIAFLFNIKLLADENINQKKTTYDICDLFMDSKPIISYDRMFGSEINAISFFVNDQKKPCTNYRYSYNSSGLVKQKIISHIFSGITVVRKYTYYDSGLIKTVIETRNNFEKKITFIYNKKNELSSIREEILSDNKGKLLEKYDALIYKINHKGNIVEIRGINNGFLGLSQHNSLIAVYDYDDYNRLKLIQNFYNPELSRIFHNDDYVENNK